MSLTNDFSNERAQRILTNSINDDLKNASRAFMVESTVPKYSYNFSWMGRPIIQYPQDIVAIQEIIWQVKPDLIIETGIAHGGSLILSASLLSLLEICGEIEHGQVVGVDIDIRQHNRIEIEKHPLNKKITMLEGSSIAPEIITEVHKLASSKKRVMVFLDSNHTHKHVLEELNLYSPMVSRGSYLVVFDTIVEDLPEKLISDRPWRKETTQKLLFGNF